MAVSNIGTYGAMQGFLKNINVTQNSINDAQIQISSGYVSQTFDGLGGNTEQFISLTAQVTRLENYHQGSSVINSRLQTANTSVSQMISLANSFKSLLVSQRSGTSNSAAFAQQVISSKDAIVGQMNTTYQGAYLFGGTNTNTPPVITPLPSPVEVGTPDTTYYQGSNQNTSFRIADGQLLENTIRADDPAFQNIIAAFHLVEGGTPSDAQMKNAQDLLDKGIQGLIGMQANVNANIVRVGQVDTQNETVRTYYTGLSQSMSKSDVVALSTRVAQDQTTLQASFSAFARISALSLSNYLK